MENSKDFVQSTYLKYYTSDYFKSLGDQHYSKEKFEKMYASHPGRMTPEQVKAHGTDIAHTRLYAQFLDTKEKSYHEALLVVSTQIIEQIVKAIKATYPTLEIKVYEGKIEKYGSKKLTLASIHIGRYDIKNIDNNACYYITPTLSYDNHFSVVYDTPYFKDTRYCTDKELMTEIGKLQDYIQQGIEPTSFIDKVYHKYENQYGVWCGKHTIGLYDVEMIQLYHTLAKAMNDNFGTMFDYSQSVIDSLYKQPVFGNIQYVGGFYLEYVKKDSATLESYYFYLGDKSKKPDFKCYSTYGKWSCEDLKALLEVLYPYVHSRYFYDTTKEVFAKRYGEYDRIGIRYHEVLDYFDKLLWNK